MRCAHPFSHALPLALIVGVVCGTGALRAADAPASPSPQKDAAPDEKPLSPKVEAKLKEFLTKVKVDVAKSWEGRIKSQIDEIASVTGLDDKGKQALEPAGKAVVESMANDWSIKMGGEIRKGFAMMPADQALKYLDLRLSQVPAYAQMDFSEENVPPFERDDWIKALHQTLTPDQMAAWDKKQQDRKDAVDKVAGNTLKQGVERIHKQELQETLLACKQIEVTAGLPKDRADKLEALANSVVDQTSEMWRKRIERMLISMPDPSLQQFAQGRFFMGANPNESPLQQSAWKDGLAAILTADEQARLQADNDARKAKRAHVLAEIMLVALDDKLALTDEQRPKLLPICERLVKDVSQLFPEDGSNVYFGYSTDMFLAASAKATDAELKPILDEVQLKRWRKLTDSSDNSAVTTDDSQAKPEEYKEPEDVDRAISSFLYKKTEDERKRVMETNVLKAEDAIRVAGLKSEAAARLQVAALGITEGYLANWRWFTEQQIRSQLQNVTPQTVKQRLDSIQDYFFQRNYGPGNRSGVWDATVKAELTEKQQDSWKKETDARSAFRDKATGDFVAAEFDRLNRLTPEQSGKLEPMISGIIRDYGPEISQVFSFNNGNPWYMEGSYSLMPLAGISDKDLKAILTKDQIDCWHGSQQYINATSLWQNVQQNHDQRVQAQRQ